MIERIQDRIVWAIMWCWSLHGGMTGLPGRLLDLASWVAYLGYEHPRDDGGPPPW